MEQWWKGAIVYQIYIRSFKDGNHDGIGDLKGILQKLNYIAKLGCDAIWISPFYQSPMCDFGYDVSDYYTVDPSMGTMKDFENLIEKAHSLNLKIIMDMILNHTSDQHTWFLESKQNKTNPKADWYVWADPGSKGALPNNWLSIFGGSAWTFEPKRNQYYLHNFLKSQPKLNYYCDDVHQAMFLMMKFWLEKGIDGFRFDAINFLYYDKALSNNPKRLTPTTEHTVGIHKGNPYGFQYHLYDNTRPEMLPFLNNIRKILRGYPGTISIGEIGSDNAAATAAAYVRGKDHLHMVYTFNLLSDRFSATYLKSVINQMEKLIEDGWPCWSFSNHDVPRALTRFSYGEPEESLATLILKLLCSLKGTAIIYQGEELGLTEATLPLEKLKDPYGLHFYPYFKGRDGARTPMPWNDKRPYAGFSNDEPWLPIDRSHFKKAISLQEQDKKSILNEAREFLFWRKKHPELIYGDINFLNTKGPILAFYRVYLASKILCIFNLSNKFIILPSKIIKLVKRSSWKKFINFENNCISPYGAVFLQEPLS